MVLDPLVLALALTTPNFWQQQTNCWQPLRLSPTSGRPPCAPDDKNLKLHSPDLTPGIELLLVLLALVLEALALMVEALLVLDQTRHVP